MYHYVYRITNILLNKHYYGKRSSKLPPHEDLGIRYFSSSTDKNFKEDQRNNPQNYKYKIVKQFSSSSEAIAYEIVLHLRFNVNVNTYFYNRAKQTAVGFDSTGQYKPLKESTKQLISQKTKGRVFSEEHKTKLRKAKVGVALSEAHKKAIGKAHVGRKRPSSTGEHIAEKLMKPANVYTKEGTLLASAVSLSAWCRDNPTYNRKHLSATARSDRTKPKSDKNRHYHKGIYAVYC